MTLKTHLPSPQLQEKHVLHNRKLGISEVIKHTPVQIYFHHSLEECDLYLEDAILLTRDLCLKHSRVQAFSGLLECAL
jgi:hypothetical protein